MQEKMRGRSPHRTAQPLKMGRRRRRAFSCSHFFLSPGGGRIPKFLSCLFYYEFNVSPREEEKKRKEAGNESERRRKEGRERNE